MFFIRTSLQTFPVLSTSEGEVRGRYRCFKVADNESHQVLHIFESHEDIVACHAYLCDSGTLMDRVNNLFLLMMLSKNYGSESFRLKPL